MQRPRSGLDAIGCQSLAVSADVTDEGTVAGMIAQTVERFGKLDILVNNAGTAVVGPPETISLADWQESSTSTSRESSSVPARRPRR